MPNEPKPSSKKHNQLQHLEKLVKERTQALSASEEKYKNPSTIH